MSRDVGAWKRSFDFEAKVNDTEDSPGNNQEIRWLS